VPTADRQKATVLVRIGFEQLDPRILPDMGVKVAFLGAPEPASRRVPPAPHRAQSRHPHGSGQAVVFVVVENRVERRAVRLGDSKGDAAEV